METGWEMMVEENDIELSLGLSVGGCFRKSEKLLPIRQKSVSSSAIDEKSGETDADLGSSVCPISSTVFVSREEMEIRVGGKVLDSERKREIHALRRQEARKKREEKQQRKRIGRDTDGIYVDGNVSMKIGLMDEKMLLETQEYQSRVIDRESMEKEKSGSERIFKKAKVTDEEEEQDVNQTSKQSHNPNPSEIASPVFPVVPMQCPYPPMDYISFPNGFAFPYGVPYWAAPPPPSAAVSDDKNVFQPVACRTLHPFQAQNLNTIHNLSGSFDSEQNGSKGGGVKQVQSSLYSSGSPGSSSSGVSDYSTSHQGGCSSDTRSHSSRSASEQHQVHTMIVNNAPGQTKYSPFSQPVECTQSIGDPAQKSEKQFPEEKPISITKPLTIKKPITSTDIPPPHSQPPQAPREAKEEANKPPTPPQNQPPQTQALPHMPCVSTTGNGPNGKTITGFLYRYTKTEVSIMCVCHGSSFTPAEFVKHAGGTDVSHPLRHIVVVPSTF